jgi:diguanylate cyclase (GGDEF)-like protein
MSTAVERRRVLLVARPGEEPALRQLFASQVLAAWDVVDADSFVRARFVLQHTACDILLVDEGLCVAEGMEGLAWLGRLPETPLVFLAANELETLRLAYEHGASICLPRALTLAHPGLLEAAMWRAARGADLHRAHRGTREMLKQCRRQVDRLVTMLWRTVPVDTEKHWFSQRHVLMRLQEEIARSGRHGGSLTVAVGELHAAAGEPEQAGIDMTEWMTDRITSTKRRCDVAGQYGLQGFLLLMVNTPRHGGVACCQRLRKALEDAAAPAESPRRPIRACFGIASLSGETPSPQSLLSSAEQALDTARVNPADPIVAS